MQSQSSLLSYSHSNSMRILISRANERSGVTYQFFLVTLMSGLVTELHRISTLLSNSHSNSRRWRDLELEVDQLGEVMRKRESISSGHCFCLLASSSFLVLSPLLQASSNVFTMVEVTQLNIIFL